MSIGQMTEVHSVQDKVYVNPKRLFIDHNIVGSFKRAKSRLEKSNLMATETMPDNRIRSSISNKE